MFYRINGKCFGVHKYFRKLFAPLVPISLVNFDEHMFQQDGAPAHTSKTTKKKMATGYQHQCFRVAIVKPVWAIMKRWLRGDPQTTMSGLKRKIQGIWD